MFKFGKREAVKTVVEKGWIPDSEEPSLFRERTVYSDGSELLGGTYVRTTPREFAFQNLDRGT